MVKRKTKHIIRRLGLSDATLPGKRQGLESEFDHLANDLINIVLPCPIKSMDSEGQ